jgi:hypothetical protein
MDAPQIKKGNMQLGYNTAGTEPVFEAMLAQARERMIMSFNYLEIGIAEGTTLASVAKWLKKQEIMWDVIGVDLVEGPFFNPIEFMRKNRDLDIEILFDGGGGNIKAREHSGLVTVVLGKSEAPKMLIRNEAINFCLIDGCHGAPCVMRDFLMVEPWIARGGIVAFHDAMPEDQGIHFQTHCHQPINVREALYRLKLLWTGTGTRHGWRFLRDVPGDKNFDPPGNGFAFFQKL